MEKEQVKEPIAPKLKQMRIGETVAYPIERYTNVQNTLTRVRREFRQRKYRTSCLSGRLEVTRVQ